MGTRVNNSPSLKRKESAPAPKKLVIKNLKVQPKLPENFEEETWNKLKLAVHAVHHSQPTVHSLEELYKATEDLCYHKLSEKLYNNVYTECEVHLKSQVQILLEGPSDPTSYLNLLNSLWLQHCNQMIVIRSIFLYLDRTYVLQSSSLRSLWDMGLQLFRTHIAKRPEVEKKSIADVIYLIEQERKGEAVDRSLLKSLVRMLVALGIYNDKFERDFIESTRIFYSSEGANLIRDLETPAFLKHADKRLTEESERVLHYLDSSTKKMLIQTTEKNLLETHVETLISKGFNALMDENRVEDLKRMFSLFQRVSALDQLKVAFVAYLKAAGSAKVNDTDPEKEKVLVQELLDFKAKTDNIVEMAFNKQESFVYGVKEAFEHFINIRANKPAELIAKFVDVQLRSGNKGVSEEELDQLLDKIMVLFRFIHGKDVFEAFYKKDLAKRLLLSKSASIDTEKSMISKLKSECGASFTNKLEGMFKDMDLSKDIMAAFKQSPKYQEQTGDIDLQVFVLTAGYWPAYTPTEITLPSHLAEIAEVFKKFYLQKYSGRRLMWQNSLGHCILKATFPSGKKELAVSLFQTVILLLFNDKSDLSFKEIQQKTAMETAELRRMLHSLACGKVKVLNKEPKGKDVSEDDTFSFNTEFKQKLFKIKINTVQLKETVEENTKTTQNVMQDRQYQIDAAIVRIMKTRKSLTHQLLVTELYNQLKFPVKPADLKKRIESLIDREYLERDPQNAQLYNYLA